MPIVKGKIGRDGGWMLLDLVRKSRSYRGFLKERKVTKEELITMVECARLAPSSVNGQPFRYYLAWEEEEVNRIFPLTGWARALPELELPHKGEEPTAYIIICQDKRIGESLSRYQKDVGIVAQTMLLAATEMGLGGCMIGNFLADKVKEELQLADYLAPMLILAIGKPTEKIVIVDIKEGESTKYYRDEEDTHYVPKRMMKDIILEKKQSKEIEWSYLGCNGPEYWGGLAESFKIADEGKRQSPINIKTSLCEIEKSSLLEYPVIYQYQKGNYKIHDTGHTIEMIPLSPQKLILGNHTYELQQFHFHEPSEHQMNGQTYDLELHLVHKCSDQTPISKEEEISKIVVIGLMMKLGQEDNPFLDFFFQFPIHGEDDKVPVDLLALLPNQGKVFQYEGSLTTPPTLEGVLWNIYETPISFSQEQLLCFKKCYSGNHRPIQEVGEREIKSFRITTCK